MSHRNYRLCWGAFYLLISMLVFSTLGSVAHAQAAQFVTFTAGDSGSSSTSVTYLNGVHSGDLIVLFSHWDNQAITATASDSAGNVYVPISGPVSVGTAGRFQAWYAKNIQGGNLEFKITYSGRTTTISLLDAAEYVGLDKTAPLDMFAVATGTGNNQNSGATATTSVPFETVVGFFGFNGYAAPYTAGTGFTFRDYDASSFLEDRSVSTTGTYQATAQSQGSGAWVAYAITFRSASQGAPALSSIAVTPANISLGGGLTQQYTALGTYSDGSTQNLTNSVTWSSTNAAIATISGGGLATATAIGATTIRAALGSISGSTGLTVTAPPALTSIAVAPINPSLVIGATQQFTATGTYSDGSTQNLTSSVTWSSTNPSGATINSAGVATAVATGSTTIHAVSGSVSGSATLTIAAGAYPWIPYDMWIDFEQGTIGAEVNAAQLVASTHGVPGVWSLVDPNDLLSIRTAAEDTGHAVTGDAGTRGMATNLNSGASGYIEWDPPAQQSSFSIGLWYKTGEAVPWSSGPFFVLFYNNSFGPMIRLSDEKSPYTNVRQIQVSPLNQAVAGVADDTWYWITMKWTQNSQGTMSVYDTSLNLVGTVTFTDTFNVPVQAIRLGNPSGSVPEPGAVSYIDDFIVDYTHGNFPLLPNIPTAVGPTTLISVAVTPTNTSLIAGSTAQYTAIGTFSNGTTQNITPSATWTSTNPNMATVNSAGLATAVAAGTTTIQATSETITGSASLTITPPLALASIVITPVNSSILVGLTQQYTALGTYSDGSTQNLTNSVTWSSTNAAIATISGGGLATATAIGATTIRAALGSISGSTGLTVTAPPALTSIAVAPINPSLVIGATQQFTATGTYSDGSTQNLTSSVTWSSTNPSGATINSAGVATAVATGSTTIHAVSGSVSGSATLTIAAGAYPWIPYDMWIDFEQGTIGAEVNAAQLVASTHGVPGVWSLVDPNDLLSIRTAAEDTGHAVTGDAGTRGMATNLNSGASGYIEWDPPAQQSSFSIGLWYKTGEAVPWSSGPFFVLFYNNSFGPMIRLSDEKSPYTNVRQIQVSPLNQAVAGVADDTWYWITMKWTQNSQGTMSVYDTSLNLVGTVTFTDTFNVPVQAIRLGNPSGSVPEPGAVSYIDDFIVDYTHGNFPLLPNIPTAVGLSFNPSSIINGTTSIGTVTLSAPAPSSGATVTLSNSNSAVANVPSSVTVPAGMTTASFAVSTGGVTFSTAVTISATYESLTATANVTVLPTTMSQLASDNFSRSSSPTLGPNWTPLLGGNDRALQLINGQVQSVALSPATGKEMYYGGMTWGSDQYSEAKIVAASGNGYEGPAVRMTSNDTHYACVVYNTGAGNASVSILIDVGGDNAVLVHSSTATVNSGDTVRCSIRGNAITMTDQTASSTLLTVTEDTISSGYPGLVDSAGSVSVNNYTLANWAAGDIAAPLTLQQLASDNFNRTNSLNLGANWHVGSGHGPVQIVSQHTEPYPAGGTPPSKEHYFAAGSFPNDQWSQIQIGVEDALGDNAAELRASDTTDTMYITDVNLTGAPGVAETRIVSVINGTITPLIIDTTWSTVNQGDYIRGEVRGNMISMIDVTTGSLLLTIIDPNVLAGYPGISMQALDGSTTDHVAGNWSGGTFH